MATFQVRVTYTGYNTYWVEADTAEDAQEEVLEEVHCADFESGTFEIEGINECEDMSLPE